MVRSLGRLTFDEAVAVMRPVLNAVAYLHRNRIVRLDLKTHNIMIDRRGRVCLIDLGIARRLDATVTSTAIIGTLYYMAPEQAEGSQADGRADIYAAGVVLYELTTGAFPHAIPPELPDAMPRLLDARIHGTPRPQESSGPTCRRPSKQL